MRETMLTKNQSQLDEMAMMAIGNDFSNYDNVRYELRSKDMLWDGKRVRWQLNLNRLSEKEKKRLK